MSATWGIHLEPGQHSRIRVSGTRGLVDVDLEAYDSEGTLLAADHAPDAAPTLVLDGGSRGGEAVLVAHVVEGAGSLRFESWPLDADSARDQPPEWDPSARGELGRLPLPPTDAFLVRAGLVDVRYDGQVAIPSVGDLRLAVRSEPGTCLAVLVSTDEVGRLALELLSPDGRVTARAESTGASVVAALCADRREEVAIAVRSDRATNARVVVRQGSAAQAEGISPLVESSRRGLDPPP